MKNYLGQGLLFTVLVFILTIGLGFVPKGWTFFGMTLRKMDIFNDVRKANQDSTKNETAGDAAIPIDSSLLGQDSAKIGVLNFQPEIMAVDSALFGHVIEDYAPQQTGLSAFFRAVDSISTGTTVRVAWYGDSFVEGDILLGDLRDTLQTKWGGAGVGFVPITSEVARFKRSLKHEYRGWTTFSIIKKAENRPLLGLNGYCYQPAPEAKFHFEGADYFKHTRRWGKFDFYYTASLATDCIWQNGGMEPQLITLQPKPGLLQSWTFKRAGEMRAFAMRFINPEGFYAFGASLEDGPGIYFDNFSVRGNSGGHLCNLDPAFIAQFTKIRPYDLIVLQVGLNAVTNSLNNMKWYEAELNRTFAHMKKCFPNQPILIVSVADRGDRIDGELATMRSVPYIVAMQRHLARKHGLLFFDLYRGMGGAGAMVRLAEHSPRWANLDYTHLTHEGGKMMGHFFADLFIREKQHYNTR